MHYFMHFVEGDINVALDTTGKWRNRRSYDITRKIRNLVATL